jgi:DNA primase
MENTRLLELLQSILGKPKATNKGNAAFHCPFCNTQKRKLEVQLFTNAKEENPWHCWVCNKAGKKITTLFKALNVDKQKFTELYRILQISPTKINVQDIAEQVKLPAEFHPLYIKRPSVEYKNALFYLLKKRGLSVHDIIKYNIGYCEDGEYAKKIIIPSYDTNGRLNYFVSRTYYDAESFRYKNPEVSKNIVGFENLISWDLPLVLVEGAFDAIAIKRNAIPLFGKTISENLKKKIIQYNVKELYICLDKDAQKQALEHAEYFINNGIVVYFVNLNEKDPSDIGFLKMKNIIQNTEPFSFSDLISLKLAL